MLLLKTVTSPILCLLLLASVMSCGVREKITSGQKDRLGCDMSAGYTWSALIADCIRTFDLPIQMTDLHTSTSLVTYGSSAHFSEDHRKAEVFHLILVGGSLILERDSNEVYKSEDGKYLLEQDSTQAWQFKLLEKEETSILASQ